MIIRKVLIVDDELNDPSSSETTVAARDDIYLGVIAQLNAIAPQYYRYEPLLCGSEEQALRELKSVNHSQGQFLSIVDLVLDEGDRFSEVGSMDLLDQILEKSRLTFFTTRRLEAAKISSLVKFQKAKRSAGLFPFELLQNQPREFARLMHRGQESYDDGKAISYIEHLQSQNISDINILLISDFHFGPTGLGNAKVDLENSLETLSEELGDRRLDLVFMLGDFTDKGQELGLNAAYSFIHNLSEAINFKGLPSDFIHLVPGNHDVVVPLSLSTNVTRTAGDYVLGPSVGDENLRKYGVQPFHHFRDRVMNGVQYFGDSSSDAILSKKHWVDTRWEAFGFMMVGFDSNSYPTATNPVVGSIDRASLDTFRSTVAEIPKARRKSLVLLVLAHHYTGDGGAERGVEEREVLRKHCSDLGFKAIIFMNGDRHGDPLPQLGRQLINDGTTPLEIAVPTFCQLNAARQEGAARGFLLLRLGSENGEVESAEVRPYTFHESGVIKISKERKYVVDHNGWRRQ